MTRAVVVGALALALVAGAFAAVATRRVVATAGDGPFAAPPPRVTATVQEAGIAFAVLPAADASWSEGTSIHVDVTTPAGPLRVSAPAGGGEAVELVVPYVRAGVVTYRVSVHADVPSEVAAGVVARAPGVAVRPLALALGARATRVLGADGARVPFLVAHPLDAWGNVALDDTSVVADLPGGGRWRATVPVRDLVAFTYLPTDDVAGLLRVAAAAGEARGERAEVDLLAGSPTSGSLEVQAAVGAVDARDPWQLRVENLRDGAGHRAIDGEALTITAEGQGEHFFLTRPVLAGGAVLSLPVGPTPGTYDVRANAGGLAFGAVALSSVLAFVGPMDLRVVEPASGGTSGPILLAGPFVDDLGATLDDGFPVTVAALGQAGEVVEQFTTRVEAGRMQWPVPPLPAETRSLEVRVGGATERVAWTFVAPEAP